MLSVLKFGGTSVADESAIKKLEEIVLARKEKVILVVSALAGVTNDLLSLIKTVINEDKQKISHLLNCLKKRHIDVAKKLRISEEAQLEIIDCFNRLEQLSKALLVLGEVSNRSRDKILSQGEILSSRIIFEYLRANNIKIEYLDNRKIIKTDTQYTEAEVLFSESKKNLEYLNNMIQENDILVSGGFIASDLKGHTTTLGRGGSDYTAAIIGSLLDADKIEIWTDVDGVLTCDPRLIPEAKRIKRLSFEEAAELAFFGAKVLHPKTIQPAVKQGIPVWVLNSRRPYDSGTEIIKEAVNKNILKAIAFRKKITVIRIYSNRMLGAFGFLSKVFAVFEKYRKSIDLVATSEVSVSLTIDDQDNLVDIVRDLSEFAKIDLFENQAIISVVGEGIRHTQGIASRFFSALNTINIPMISMGASEVNLSIVLSEEDVENAVIALHKEFFTNELDSNIFIDI